MSQPTINATQITSVNVPAANIQELQQGHMPEGTTTKQVTIISQGDQADQGRYKQEQYPMLNRQDDQLQLQSTPAQTADLSGLPTADRQSQGQLYTYGMGAGMDQGVDLGMRAPVDTRAAPKQGVMDKLGNKLSDLTAKAQLEGSAIPHPKKVSEQDAKLHLDAAREAASQAQHQLATPQILESQGQAVPKQGVMDKLSNKMAELTAKDQLEGSTLPHPKTVSEHDAQLHLQAGHLAAQQAQQQLATPQVLESRGEAPEKQTLGGKISNLMSHPTSASTTSTVPKQGLMDKLSNKMSELTAKDQLEGSALPHPKKVSEHDAHLHLNAAHEAAQHARQQLASPQILEGFGQVPEKQTSKPKDFLEGSQLPHPGQVSESDAQLHLNAGHQAALQAQHQLATPQVLESMGEKKSLTEKITGLASGWGNKGPVVPKDQLEGTELPHPGIVSKPDAMLHLNAAHDAAEAARELLPKPVVLESQGEKVGLLGKISNAFTRAPASKDALEGSALPHPKEVTEADAKTHFFAAHEAAQEAANRLPAPTVLESQGEKMGLKDHITNIGSTVGSGLGSLGSGIGSTASSALQGAGGATAVGTSLLKGTAKVGLGLGELVLDTVVYGAKAAGHKIAEAMAPSHTAPQQQPEHFQPTQQFHQQPEQQQLPQQPQQMPQQMMQQMPQQMGNVQWQPQVVMVPVQMGAQQPMQQQQFAQQPMQPSQQQPMQPNQQWQQPPQSLTQKIGDKLHDTKEQLKDKLTPSETSMTPSNLHNQPKGGDQEVLVTTDAVTTTTTTPEGVFQVTDRVTTVVPTDMVPPKMLDQIRKEGGQQQSSIESNNGHQGAQNTLADSRHAGQQSHQNL